MRRTEASFAVAVPGPASTDPEQSADLAAGSPCRPEATPYPADPVFVATIDQARGTVRTRGNLDRASADLLCGTVVALQRNGHRCITVLMPPSAAVDAVARRLLTDLAQELTAGGVQFIVR